jgi:hypothetical protein
MNNKVIGYWKSFLKEDWRSELRGKSKAKPD